MTDATVIATIPATDGAVPPGASASDALGLGAAAETAEPVQVTIPGKDAKPEDWSKYFDDIGAPKTADAYELPVPDGQDGAFAKTAAEWMAQARLTPQQAKDLAGKWNEHVGNLTKAQTEAKAKTEADAATAREAAVKRDETALSNEWGAEKDKNMEHAKRAAREFVRPYAGEKTADIITAIEDKIGYAATMKFMHAIGSKIGEANPRGLGAAGTAPAEKPGLLGAFQAVIDKK